MGTLLIVVLALGIALFRNVRSEAASGMPADQQSYWNWVSTTDQDPAAALEAGVDLLYRYPHLRLLYLRLPAICRAAEAAEGCRKALERVQPSDARTALYRDAARIQLLEADQADAARAGWQYIARASDLDPTLARLIVDEARRDPGANWLPQAEAAWEKRLQQDSAAVGAAFGLAYAANLRSDWAKAEPLLRRVTTLLPDDPEAYRELGRIYYFTGNPAAFEQALEAGIKAAEANYDQEQGLILRGNLGLNLYQQGKLDKAARLFEEALVRSRILADRETEGFNLYRLAGVRFKQFRYDEAMTLLDSAEVRYAEHAPRQLPEVHVLRGATLRALYRFSDAEQVLERAAEAANVQQNVAVEIQALVALVQLRFRMGRYAAAREIGLEALQLAQKYRQVDAEIAARLVLGDVEHRWGNFEKAMHHYEQGLGLARRSKNQARITELHDHLGRAALDVGNLGSAQAHYEAMLEEARQYASPADLARLYDGLGRVYSHFGNFGQAVHHYDDAIERLRVLDSAELLTVALIDKAWALLGQDAFDEAEAVLQEAQPHRGRITEDAIYQLEIVTGNLRLEQGRYEEALGHLNAAVRIEARLWRPSSQWHLLHAIALAHWRLGHAVEAENYFREAVETIEAMRENLNSREHRAAFVQNKVAVYKNFVTFLEEQGRREEAFYFTEHARSRSLADLLQAARLERASHTDRAEDQVIEAERRRRALAEAMEGADLQPEDASAKDTRARLTRASHLRREYQRADSVYRVNIQLLPENRLYTADPLFYDSTRAILLRDEAFIVYNLRSDQEAGGAAETPASTVYVITRDTLYVRALDMRLGDLEESVRFFRDRLSASSTGPGSGWEPISRRLFEHLLEPVLAGLPPSIRHLHLVPEGVLHYLPFAALQDDAGRFLAEYFTLSVAPSASILKICRENNPMLWRSILLIADPERRLPGTRREAEAIAAIPRIRPLKLLGEQATQRNVREFAEDYDILHIATHGSFVSRAPWSSYLELYNDVLSVEEIDRLPLDQTYLVTLSACETALSGGLVSDIPAGDEWIGLNQAFLAAGAPTVMASLWPVDDKVSSTFMEEFYGELLDARGKAQALAAVQRQFIRNPGTTHPFYWAAFTVIGDPL